jgi:hypothetical protein
MWDLTQAAVDQRWDALIRPVARRRRVRLVLWRGLACLCVIALVLVTWFLVLEGVADAIQVPRLGLRP